MSYCGISGKCKSKVSHELGGGRLVPDWSQHHALEMKDEEAASS